MALNLRNHGYGEGRLVRDPQVFENKDGSKKVKLTIAVQDNFKSKDENGKPAKGSQFIQLEAFVNSARAGSPTVYDLMHKGDMIGVQYSVRTNNYKGADGKDVFGQSLVIETVDLKETKATVAARQAGKTEAEEPVAAPMDPDEDSPFAD